MNIYSKMFNIVMLNIQYAIWLRDYRKTDEVQRELYFTNSTRIIAGTQTTGMYKKVSFIYLIIMLLQCRDGSTRSRNLCQPIPRLSPGMVCRLVWLVLIFIMDSPLSSTSDSTKSLLVIDRLWRNAQVDTTAGTNGVGYILPGLDFAPASCKGSSGWWVWSDMDNPQ